MLILWHADSVGGDAEFTGIFDASWPFEGVEHVAGRFGLAADATN